MTSEDQRIRKVGRAAMLKANIETARKERGELRRLAAEREQQKKWTHLIRQWKEELKALTGEEY